MTQPEILILKMKIQVIDPFFDTREYHLYCNYEKNVLHMNIQYII